MGWAEILERVQVNDDAEKRLQERMRGVLVQFPVPGTGEMNSARETAAVILELIDKAEGSMTYEEAKVEGVKAVETMKAAMTPLNETIADLEASKLALIEEIARLQGVIDSKDELLANLL